MAVSKWSSHNAEFSQCERGISDKALINSVQMVESAAISPSFFGKIPLGESA